MNISIIIPIYNAEKYLERCVRSVVLSLKKSGVKGEILLIDNSSSDGSMATSESLRGEYPNFVQIMQCKKPGAAAVRNFGASKARGEYIWFVDADDVVAPEAISKLQKLAHEAKADLVMMGAARIYPDGHTDYLSAVEIDPSDPRGHKSRFVRYGMGPWQVLIRRAWWEEHGFRFREGATQEDMELMSALILYTDRYASVDEPLYLYYQNDGSVLHSHKFSPRVFDIFTALEGLYNRFEKAGAAGEYHDELEWFFIWNLLIDAAKDFARFPEARSGFARSREMLSKYFPTWRKNRFLREKSLKLRLRVRLNYIK